MGRGNAQGSIALIGEAPGEAESRTGKPFMGAAGQELQKILQALDAEDEVYITNICKCRPPNNRTPEECEKKVCMIQYGMPELEIVNPKAIVLLGKTASDMFAMDSRGIVEERLGWSCVATYHPAYYFYTGHNPAVLRCITSAIKLARSVVRGV